jgi:hypothetical protein
LNVVVRGERSTAHGAADAAGAADEHGKAAGTIEQSRYRERASCAGERRPFRGRR